MRQGIYFILITALISGFSIFSNKIFVSLTDPLVFTAIRNMMVALLLTVVLFTSQKYQLLRLLTKKELLALGVIGSLGGGVAFALFFVGLAQIGGVTGNLIHKTLFLWVAVLAIPFLGERLHKLQLIGYFLIFISTFVIGGISSISLSGGALYVLFATILWAIENVMAKKILQTVSSEIVGWARILFGLPVLFLAVLITGKSDLLVASATYSSLPLITSSLFLTAYVYTWYKGLAKVPVTLASSLLVIAPIITSFLSAFFISANLPKFFIVSTLVLTGGVVMVLAKVKKTVQFRLS